MMDSRLLWVSLYLPSGTLKVYTVKDAPIQTPAEMPPVHTMNFIVQADEWQQTDYVLMLVAEQCDCAAFH